MKKKLCILCMLLLTASVLLTACSDDDAEAGSSEDAGDTAEEADDDSQSESGFVFETDGTRIQMNEEASSVLESLGEEKSYFEAESCAFKGLDKTYTYAGFKLYTYPIDEIDYVQSVEFMDDTVATMEGITIGDSLDEVVAAYGDDYEENGTAITYTKDDAVLEFIISGDVVEAVNYTAITD